MTLEEAKKILEKAGFVVERFQGVLVEDVKTASCEKIEVSEAMRVVAENGYLALMEESKYKERKARLKKEYEKNTKAPVPGEGQPKEGNLKAATKMFGAQAREIMRLTAENAELRETIDKMKEGNPALKDSASQFNDALLDEQAKKIAELTKDKELMKKATLSQLDDFIEIYNLLTKESQKTKRLGKEIAKLNGIIHDKNAVLSDVAEELRLSKIREKNLTEVCQKYVKEVEDLRKKLADNVVDKIDAQALKSAESALAWKEKLVYYKEMAIADLRKELKAQKGLVNHISKKYDGAKINLNLRMKECEKLEEALEEKTKLVEIVRKGSREYCEYGIAAEKMIQKMAKDIVDDRPVSPKDYEQYRHWAKGYRFNPQLPERTDEEEKKPNTSKSTLDDLKEKAYNSFNAKACNLGLVGSKDGNGIIDQMIGVDIAEEGGDHSDVIVLCGKDFIDAIKKMK